MKNMIKNLFLLLILFNINTLFAAETLQPITFPKDHEQHLSASTEVWMFTGEVETEEGKKYAYMYKLKRKNNELSVFANVIDLTFKSKKSESDKSTLNDKQEVFVYKATEASIKNNNDKDANKNKYSTSKESSSHQSSDKSIEWKVGKAFIKYNVIGDSWFFGVLDEKNGFNFRVKGVRTYVLNGKNGYLVEKKDNYQASYSAQSMDINGHLTLDGQSYFVTGKNSWFEHSWGKTISGHQSSKYALITCRFNDNTGLMLYEWFGKKNRWSDRLKTGTYQNALDEKMLLSDFSLAKSKKTSTKMDHWTIVIPALKINIKALGDTIPEYDVIQVKDNKEGYCFVSQRGF